MTTTGERRIHIWFTNAQLAYRLEWRAKRKRHHMRTRRERAKRGPWVVMTKHSAQGQTTKMLGFRTGELVVMGRDVAEDNLRLSL